MKKNLLIIILATVFITLIIVLSKNWHTENYYRISGTTQGTTYHITYASKSGKDIQPEIDSLLADFDHSLSTYLPGSIISRINQNDTSVLPDKHFLAVFKKSREVYEKTDGAFDITVAPIVNAWGFGFTERSNVDSAMIDSLLQYVGMDKVRLVHGRIVKQFPQSMLDVNAIAQGYSVDVVSEYLQKQGIKNYLVEIGGELRARGRNASHNIWTIGIDKPIDNNFDPGKILQTKLRLKNSALATSGNYRSFFEKDGIKYVHTINPKSGYPVLSNLLSATVKSDDCITADAYATAFMVMGLEKSIHFLSAHKELQAYLVYSDKNGNFQSYVTKNLKKDITE